MAFEASMIRYLAVGGLLMVAACGGNDVEKERAALAAYDDAKLAELADAGNFDEVVRSINAKKQLGVDTAADNMLLLRIRLDRRDGIGAEAIVEKLLAEGAEPGPLAVPQAQALFIQGRIDPARKALEQEGIPEADQLELYLLKGDIARLRGEDSLARIAYGQAIEAGPQDFRGYLSLGLLNYREGRLDESDALADKALALAPEDPMVNYLAGASARHQGRFDDAVARLKLATRDNPGNLLAELELASVYIELDRREEAEAALDVVYAQAPDNTMAFYLSSLLAARQGKAEQAEALLLRAGDLTRDFMPAVRAYGLVLSDLGKYSQAQKPLMRYLQSVPTDNMVRLRLADAMIKRGNPRHALEILAPLLKEGEELPAAQALAASARAASGDTKAAEKLFQSAAALAGDSGADAGFRHEAAKKAAVSRFLGGDRKGAIADLRKLAAGAPDDGDLQVLLANYLVQVGDFSGAEAQVPHIGDPEKSAVAANMAGYIRFAEGQYEASLPFYAKAIELNPGYASALKNRGLANVVLRRFGDALPDLQAAEKFMPNDPQLHALLGRTLLEVGRPVDALPHLKAAQAGLPNSPIVLADQAETLAALGFPMQAITMAADARKLAPTDEKFAAYLDGKVKEWQIQDERLRAERQQAEEAKAKAVREAMEKAAETRAAIKEDSKAKDAPQPAPEPAPAQPEDDGEDTGEPQ